MKWTLLAISFLFLSAFVSFAAEEKAVVPTKEVPAVAAATAPVVGAESEKAKDWKGLQAQEQWVARLKKQTDGEVRQLSEMRSRVANKYKLDPKIFEIGGYLYDEKTDSFVER